MGLLAGADGAAPAGGEAVCACWPGAWGWAEPARARRCGQGLAGHGWAWAARVWRACPGVAGCPGAAGIGGVWAAPATPVAGTAALAACALDRGGTRDRPDRRRGLLDTCGRRRAHALLELGSPLGRASGPLAQALQLPGLGEEQQRQQRDAGERGERRDRPDLRERVREREREQRVRHEPRECMRGAGASRGPSSRAGLARGSVRLGLDGARRKARTPSRPVRPRHPRARAGRSRRTSTRRPRRPAARARPAGSSRRASCADARSR